MNGGVRLQFQFALAFSLMLHLAVLASPGWELHLAEDAMGMQSLDAKLLPLASQPAAPAVQQAAPVQKRAPRRPLAPPESAGSKQAPVKEAAEDAAEDAAVDSAVAAADAVPDTPAQAEAAPTFTTAFASIWPQRGRIRFDVTKGDSHFVVGQAEHRWQHDGTTYQLRAITETVGIVALIKPATALQESRGNFVAAGLQPLEFKAERNGKLHLNLHIDPADTDASPAMTGQTQDLLSLLYQLGALPPGGTEFAVLVATGRKIERHTILLLETLTLDTAFGARQVQHLKLPGNQIVGAAHDESTEVWLDIATRLPLKIRHRDKKGEVFDLTATAVELDQPQ